MFSVLRWLTHVDPKQKEPGLVGLLQRLLLMTIKQKKYYFSLSCFNACSKTHTIITTLALEGT